MPFSLKSMLLVFCPCSSLLEITPCKLFNIAEFLPANTASTLSALTIYITIPLESSTTPGSSNVLIEHGFTTVQ